MGPSGPPVHRVGALETVQRVVGIVGKLVPSDPVTQVERIVMHQLGSIAGGDSLGSGRYRAFGVLGERTGGAGAHLLTGCLRTVRQPTSARDGMRLPCGQLRVTSGPTGRRPPPCF